MPRRFGIPMLPERPRTRVDVGVTIASASYLRAVGAQLVSGADFTAPREDACGIALVNREAADAYFGGKPIDGAVIVDRDAYRARIVGVVETPVLRVVERDVEPMIYLPFDQVYSPSMTLIAQTSAATPELVSLIDGRLQELDGSWVRPQVMTLEERLLRTALGPERIATALVAACAALALALGLIGVFGVMADAVRARQREIALRLALGAPASRIVYGVFRDGLRLAGAGTALGMAIAWLVVYLVLHADSEFARPPGWVWAACPAVLFVMVALASIVPARWALAVNPLAIARER
jgi:putative ABC transport system permease protein